MKLTDYRDIEEYLHGRDDFYLSGKTYPLGDLYHYTPADKLIFKPVPGTDMHRAAQRAITYAKDCPEYEVFAVGQGDELLRVTKDDDAGVIAAAITGRPVSPDEWVRPEVMCVVEAAEDGDLERVRVLVEELGEDVNKKNHNGWPALNRAAYRGHTDVCAYLLERGAKINEPEHIGYTALHLAGMGGQEATARFLLDHGADAQAKDREGKLPIDLARGNRCTKTVAVLQKHMEAQEATRKAAAGTGRSAEMKDAILEHTVLQKGISLSPAIKLGKQKPQ